MRTNGMAAHASRGGLLCLGDYSAKWVVHRNTYIPTGVIITPDFVPQVDNLPTRPAGTAHTVQHFPPHQ